MTVVPTSFSTALSAGSPSDLPFTVIAAPGPGRWLSFFVPPGNVGSLGLAVVPEPDVLDDVRQEILAVNEVTGGEQLEGTTKFLLGVGTKTSSSPTGFSYVVTDPSDYGGPLGGCWGSVCETETQGEKIVSVGDRVIHGVRAEYYSDYEAAYVQSDVELVGLHLPAIDGIGLGFNDSPSGVYSSTTKPEPTTFPWPNEWPADLGEGSKIVLVYLLEMKLNHPASTRNFADGATLAFTGLV